MDACLFAFATDDFVAKDMRVVDMVATPSDAAKAAVAAGGNKDAASLSISVIACVARNKGCWRVCARLAVPL